MSTNIARAFLFFCLITVTSALGQNSFRSDQGWGINFNTNFFGATEFGGGVTWDFANSLGGPANRFFRFHTDFGGCIQDWGPGTDQEMTPGNSISLSQGNSAAYYAHVENTSWHYIFRTRNVDACSSAEAEAVYFEIQGDVRDISTVSQSPTTVYPGQDVEVSITLSGASNIGQGYYLRYSIDDDWANSPIVELSGSGTSFSGTISAASNTPDINIKYYVFSSGENLTISPSDADFFTFSLNNNGGSNYQYTVESAWVTAQDGAWETPTTWLANAVPSTNQPISIDGHSVTTNSDVSVSSLSVRVGGSLALGTNNSLTLSNYNNITINGDLSGNTGSALIVPEGGYLNGNGNAVVYDIEIGEMAGIGNKTFFLDSDLQVTHDLLIEDNGELRPGAGQLATLDMTGANGNIYVHGLIDCVPNLGNTTGEHLSLHIATGAQIILRPTTSVLGDIKFGNITIDTGASLVSDAAGVLDIELQFGTLVCNGILNFGQTSPGVVNVTLRGAAGNNYAISSSNAGQVLQFSDLLIGSNGANDGGDLQLASGSESIEMRVSGDFSNYFKFTPQNASESITVVMNGFSTIQEIRADLGQTFNNKTTFASLTINNSAGSVNLKSSSMDADPNNNVSFEISGTLTLSQGKLTTLESGIRHNLIVLEGADIVDTGAQSIEAGLPCYIEGPIIRETGIGIGQTLTFPVGQQGDFRNMVFQADVANSSVQIKVEHFSFSANFAGMSVVSPVINVSDARFWNIKANNPSNLTNSQFTLSYGDLVTDGITSENDLRVVWAEQDASADGDLTNDVWTAIGTNGGAGGNLTSGVYSFPSGVNQIDLTLGNVGIGVNPLPVTWQNISCSPFPNYNQINWSTSSESNTSYFILQGAGSDFVFKYIDETEAQGWSTEKTDYTLIDTYPALGTNYYRVKQIDLDGSYSFSEIVSAANTGQLIVYPNPFEEAIFIEGEHLLKGSIIEIWSSMGVLLSKHNASETRFTIPAEDLASGIYFLKARSRNGELVAFKMIKN